MKQLIDAPRSDATYRKFIEFWKKEQEGKLFADQEKFLKHTLLLEELSHNNETLFVLFDTSRYKILYFGDNMESIFGYSKRELKKHNILLFFRILIPSQLSFPFDIARWTKRLYASLPEKIRGMRMKFSYCGIRVRHKQGHDLSLLVQYHSIACDENGHSTAGIIIVEDASHLLKADFYWARSSYSKTMDCIGYFHSRKETDQQQDIVSDREKEILRLIATGFSSKEIAEHLFITQNTVEKHRKNMLARSGAKDTTALVHICRRLGII